MSTTKRFGVRTEPLIAEIGDSLVLKFLPEVDGTKYLDSYRALMDVQKAAGDEEDSVKAAEMRLGATADFLKEFAVPETVATLDDPETVIPFRILGEVVEWLTGEYSGTSGDDEGKGAKGARPTPRR
jgi:hypothetical protein